LDDCFVVRDHNGQALSYIYYESEPGRRSAAKLLTKDEARRIAVNIAKLPDYSKGCAEIRILPHAGYYTAGGQVAKARIKDNAVRRGGSPKKCGPRFLKSYTRGKTIWGHWGH
jgi:hypothetical protein